MAEDLTEEFARKLVQWVRDRAIAECDAELSPDSRSPVAQRWRQAIGTGDAAGAIAEAIPDCVDSAVFSLLDALDQGTIRLVYVGDDETSSELGDPRTGELGGWYQGSPGWRHRYSSQRFRDDFSDLAE